MSSHRARAVKAVTILALAAVLLSGCDTVSRWFDAGGKVSKLKGTRISVMSLSEDLGIDKTIKDEKVILPAPYANPAWPQPGGYPTNAMYHLAAPGPLAEQWISDAGTGSGTNSRLTASPIVAGGNIYVLDAAAHVFAYNAKTGEDIWDQSVAPPGDSSTAYVLTFGLFGSTTEVDPTTGFGGGICYDNGKLFVSDGFGQLLALNAATGKILWRKSLGVPIFDAPVANGGRVFVASQDNHFHAFDQRDGRELWDHQGITESAGMLVSTSAAVAGEFVIVPYTSGELYAFRVQNGRPAWNDMLTRSGNTTALSALDDIAGRPVVDRNMVFAVSHSGTMAAINLDSGERIWSRDIASIQTPWVAGDFIYVLSTQNELICLTRKEGRVKWIRQLRNLENPKEKDSDPVTWSGPVLVSDRLLLVSSDGFALSVSPYTGKILGRVMIPDGSFIPPIVANNTVYILTNDAELVALR